MNIGKLPKPDLTSNWTEGEIFVALVVNLEDKGGEHNLVADFLVGILCAAGFYLVHFYGVERCTERWSMENIPVQD